MFQLTSEEYKSLRFQFGIFKKGRKFKVPNWHLKLVKTRFLSRRDHEDITNCDTKMNNRNWSQIVTGWIEFWQFHQETDK